MRAFSFGFLIAIAASLPAQYDQQAPEPIPRLRGTFIVGGGGDLPSPLFGISVEAFEQDESDGREGRRAADPPPDHLVVRITGVHPISPEFRHITRKEEARHGSRDEFGAKIGKVGQSHIAPFTPGRRNLGGELHQPG